MQMSDSRRLLLLRALVLLGLFVATGTLRTWDISRHFWLLTDQWRDWEVALMPLWDLPLVGSPTHVHGYTIGPAFYWILWAIRVTIGPFFDYLPHAGGIGQAWLATAADTLLLVAVWRRTSSPWIAVAAFILITSSSFDLSVAALVWNPTMGATLIKCALAMVVGGWHRRSTWALAATAALAWSAVHAYTGAVFAAVATLAVLSFATDTRVMARRVLVVGAVVALLQLPYVVHRYLNRNAPIMSVVTGGVADILSGETAPNVTGSARSYVESVGFFQGLTGWHWPTGLLVLGGVALAVRYRRDPELVWILLMPQVLAIAGYALFVGALDGYYYLSLLPISVLTVTIGCLPRTGRAAQMAGVVAVVLAAALVPQRAANAHQFELPEYEALVTGSRTILAMGQPIRAIHAGFDLPHAVNVEHPYWVMGGQFDKASAIHATIHRDGSVTYEGLPRH